MIILKQKIISSEHIHGASRQAGQASMTNDVYIVIILFLDVKEMVIM